MGPVLSGRAWERKLPRPRREPDVSQQSRSATPEPTRPLLFLHIRKTAGCSVRNWLKNKFRAAACLEHCHTLAHEHTDPSTYQFVAGHVGFSYLARFRTRPICFVVLRQPLERALSAYCFYRRNDARYLQWLRETVAPEEAEERARLTRRLNELPLADFLDREPELAQRWLGNVQSRCLLSRANPGPIVDGEMLEEATRNLKSCELVGLTEELPRALARVASYMGWEDDGSTIPHDNPTANRLSLEAIPPRVRDRLTELNRVDAELYRVAERLIQSPRPAPRVSPPELPGCSEFTFDQPILGGGWHPRERDERGWFCWLGQRAWLDLRHEGEGDRVLEVHVAHILRPPLLDGLQVAVNGRRLPTRIRCHDRMSIIEAAVPSSLVNADRDRLRVSFTLAETIRPCDLVPGNPDTRALGVALSRVRLVPGKRAA
jgi:hypothetical protein